MPPFHIETPRLKLVLQTRDEVRAQIEHLPPHELAEVSPALLALLDGSVPSDPWIHGFMSVHRTTGSVIGGCAFKGPPGADGIVEIAYYVAPEHQGKGYATESATALVKYALDSGQVRIVRAHTLTDAHGSAQVLRKCGFRQIGEVIDPKDGLVLRWEIP